MYRGRIPGFLLVTIAGLVTLPPESRCQDNSFAIAHPFGTDAPQKFDNGLQIFWRDSNPNEPIQSEKDPDATIEIFDNAAHQLAVCRVAPAILAFDAAFTGVSIWDVSARKPGFIAVAAVYTRTALPNLAVLLYFNWDGILLQRTETSDIRFLKIDGTGHVWALNDFDPENPSKFVFSEFDAAGSIIRGILQPQARWSTNESMSTGGQTSFGVTSGHVWAWLPESRTLIVADCVTGEATIYQPALPNVPGSSFMNARHAELLPDGRLLMDVSWLSPHQQQAAGFDSAWFVWSSNSGWKRLPAPVSGRYGYLYGVNENQLIFLSTDPGLPAEFRSPPVSDLLTQVAIH